LSFFPFEVYSTGGDVITAVVKNLGVQGLSSAQISVSVLKGDSQAISVSEGVTASYSETPAPPPITKTATVSFPVPPVSSGGLATAALRYVGGGEVSFVFNYLAAPTGAAVLTVRPSTGKSSGGFSILLYLTNMLRVSDASLIKVKVAGVQLAGKEVTSVISTRTETIITFNAPSQSTGGDKEIQAWQTGREANLAKALFYYEDVNQAAIEYVDPRSVASERSSLVYVGILNLGLQITSTSALSLVVTSSISGVSVTVDSIVGSTLLKTDLVLKVAASPASVTEATDVSVSIKPIGASPIKTSVLTFSYLPAGQPRVASFSPVSVYQSGLVLMVIDIANFPSREPRAGAKDVLVVFIDGVRNVTASTLTYKSDAAASEVQITAVVPSGDVGSVTPKVLVQSKGSSISFG
jgi:hypothetical protein